MDKTDKMALPCPLCGELLTPGTSKCENCGASVPRQTRESLAALIDGLSVNPQQAQRLYNLGYRSPEDLKGKDLDEVLEEIPRLFLCPSCGAFVHEKDEKCSRCGAEFGGEAVEIEDYLLREERPCPHCGEPIHVDAESCPACGKPVAEAKGVSLGSTYMCPSCGVTVLEGQAKCEVCGTDLSPTSLIASKAMEIEAVACQKCGATLDPETGICPYCSKTQMPEEEGKAEEAMEEIDKFLEHLASVPITKGPSKTIEERALAKPPVAEKSPEELRIKREIEEELLAPEKPEPERLAPEELVPEKPAGTVEAIPEVEAEEALEELGAEVKGLPMVKLLKPSYEKVPHIATSATAMLAHGTMAIAAEVMLYATAVGLSLQYLASKTGDALLEWVLFILFGAAWGLGVAVALMLAKNLRGALVRAWQPLLGTLLIVLIPMHWYAGTAWPEYLDIVLAAFGLVLWIPWMLRTHGRVRWLLLWGGGSTIALIMSPASALSINIGGNLVASVLWAISAVLVLAGVIVSLRTRWVHWSIDAVLRKGEEDFSRRDFRKSVEDYDKAIEIARRSGDEDLATPWYSKGAALVILGRYEEALKAIDESLRINPNNEIAWVNKGNALARMGDYRSALRAFNSAIRANPRYEVAWNNKGNALARLGRYGESLKCYDLALQVDPKYRGAWVNKGFVLAKLGEFEEAAVCAEKVMTLSGAVVA